MVKDKKNQGSVELGDDGNKTKAQIQERKEDLQTYCTLCLVILLGTVITLIKIVLLDMNDPDFSSIFDSNETDINMKETESNISSPMPEPSSTG
jgi:hypothetical protein